MNNIFKEFFYASKSKMKVAGSTSKVLTHHPALTPY